MYKYGDTLVISTFAGYIEDAVAMATATNLKVLNLDSPAYTWIVEKRIGGKRTRNPEFPNNYINAIKENIGKYDVIFISSHENVRIALEEANVDYIAVHPKLEEKYQWVARVCIGENYLKTSDNYNKKVLTDDVIGGVLKNWDTYIKSFNGRKALLDIEISPWECITVHSIKAYLDIKDAMDNVVSLCKSCYNVG